MFLRKPDTATPARLGVAGIAAALVFFAGTATSREAPMTIVPMTTVGTVALQSPALAANAPTEYVVQDGDTLWDISATFLRDPWFWPEIWYVNPEIVNPHLIYPGDVLALVYIDGQPRVTTARGSSLRLSPQARVTPLSEAVTSIPFEVISAFLSQGTILEKGEAENLPYLLEVRGDHMIAAAGNQIYVRGVEGAPVGTRYSVVHIGEALIDPDNDRVMGYHGLWVGEGTMRRGGDPATVDLTASAQEATRGDRLVPATVDVPLNFFPKAPSTDVDGRIMAVIGGVSQIGQYQVVVINRGATDGLAQGDVLTVFQAGDEIQDRIGGGKVKLPDEPAGTLMVFKTYDEIAYGLVMEATEALHIYDPVRNPI
ncbi:MAG: LysM peptidoglycan-binding domain-containing protein [Pseudomonadota bacterium]